MLIYYYLIFKSQQTVALLSPLVLNTNRTEKYILNLKILSVSHVHNQESFWKFCFHGNNEYPIIYLRLILIKEICYEFTEIIYEEKFQLSVTVTG